MLPKVQRKKDNARTTSMSTNVPAETTMAQTNEKTTLAEMRKRIKSHHPAKNKIPKDISQLVPSKDSRKIKYFPEMTDKVRESFNTSTLNEISKELVDLEFEGPKGSGKKVGQIWHADLKKCIESPTSDEYEHAKAVIKALKSEDSIVKGIEFLQAEFPLCGYMADEQNSKTYFWNGKADAIGWFEDNYVIVDWKAVDLLRFWKKNRFAYGNYLHQCIVYAKLFELHLPEKTNKKLPYILIVPISNTTGKQIHPALFRELPEACKNHIEKYEWSTDSRVRSLISVKKEIIMEKFHDNDSDQLDGATVRQVFKDDTTVRQLLDELGLQFSKLKIKDELTMN